MASADDEQKRTEELSYSAIMHQKITSMLTKAEAALERGDTNVSVTILSRAIAIDPTNPQLFRKRAEAYFQLCDYASAIANYRKTVSLSLTEAPSLTPRMADAHYRNGRSLASRGEMEEALDAFSEALRLRPDEREYTMQRIHCLLLLRRYDDCLRTVHEETKHGHPSPELYLIHAKISLVFEKNAEVYRCLSQALELDPAHQEAIEMKEDRMAEAKKLQSQCVKYLLLGQQSGALRKISTAIECYPEEAEFHVLRGAIHRQSSDYTTAVEEFLTAIDKSPDRESPVYSAACRQLVLTCNDFAVFCYRRGKYSEAVQLLNKALQDEKTEAGLYVNRGDCFYHQNNLYFALADYCRAQHISPNSRHILNRVAITQCELGVKEFGGSNFSEAEKLFSAAIGNNPTVSHFYLCRARVKYELMSDEAREDIIRVLILEPECDTCLPLIARLFPGKTRDDLLNSPSLAITSTKLTQTIHKHSETTTKERLPESEEKKKMEHELEELFTQLKLIKCSPTPAGAREKDGASTSSLVIPVLPHHTLPSPTPHTPPLTHLPHTTLTSSTPQQGPPLPREWPVLSLPLPHAEALLTLREREGGVTVLPDREACEREREFHTQLYYTKKDCTAEVQKEIQRSPSVISPPRTITTPRSPPAP